MDKLCDHNKQDMDEIKRLEFLKGKRLADPYIGQPGRADLQIGIKYLNRARCHMRLEDAPDRDMTAMETQFGWVLGGDSRREGELATANAFQPAMRVSCEDQPLNQTLSKVFQREEDDDTSLVVEEKQVVDLFQNTTITLEGERYEVRLPRKERALPLGETKVNS